uniref:Anaphase-promoting complex subunit 5 n=1 Tax=Hyaloperonospora arabidopsidis (strain Emoy2) TaxID=559515 RepID=M4C2B7_HYAAE
MGKWNANSYILSVCLLICEYVRQQQQDVKRTGSGDESVASLVDASPVQTPDPAPVISRQSLNALARFLTLEIQHPKIMTNERFKALHNLLRRLEIKLDNTKDFEQLSWQVVSILTKIESPDDVWNTVEQISECVAPLQISREDEDEDMDVNSASLTLVRTSLLGVFVRGFLLALNRLLFDGLSRLFDDVQQYLEEFRADVEMEKKMTKDEQEEDIALELTGSPASQHLWKESKIADDGLLLSPIQLVSATTPSGNYRQSTMKTQMSMNLDSHALSEKSLEKKAVRVESDPSVWSTDQLNYVLSDMVREMEGGRSLQRHGSQQEEDLFTKDQRCLLLETMNGSNPNVLFIRYLSFLRDRDYQGALDSLHHYHDVLSPRQGPCLSDNNGGDGTTFAPAGGARLHYRGSGIQYAALNLAGLQIVFDHHVAAAESIHEAIRVAQHHGDHICVAFALAWMIRIKQRAGASKGEVLQIVGSCLDRAKELRLPTLQILATLAEVESDLMRCCSASRPEIVGSASQFVPHIFAAHAPSPRPLHIWSRLRKTLQSIATVSTPPTNVLSKNGSRAVNALQMTNGTGSHSHDQSSGNGMCWVKSTEAVLDTIWNLSGKVTLATANGWGVFGHRSLKKVFSRMHSLCYGDSASTDEIALMVSKMAISDLAHTEKGVVVYVRALEFLISVAADENGGGDQRHLLKNATYQRALHHLLFLWALDRSEFARADVHLSAILSLSPQGKDFPAYLEATMFQANLLTALGDYTRSLELLESLEVTCSEQGIAYLYAQVLMAISRTRVRAAAPHAPFASLNVLLKSIDVCRSHHYDLLLAEAHVIMAEMYIAMGKLQDAYSLMNDQMPLVMENGSVSLRGECLLVLAKTMVASIKQSEECTDALDSAANEAIKTLTASSELFSQVQNVRRLKEVCYLQSLVHHHMALQAKRRSSNAIAFCTSRESAAAAFLKFSSQLDRAALLIIEPFFDLQSVATIRQVVAHRSAEL